MSSRRKKGQSRRPKAHRFRAVYDQLYAAYGPQDWWPGETAFEIMVGAVLTQNTAWVNVERAIANLKQVCVLSPRAIVQAHPKRLAAWLKPSGYFNVKAKRLRAFCAWLISEGGERALAGHDTALLRQKLLDVHGVGPETADDILLYAFERPVFVIDAYTRRIFKRLGLVNGEDHYEQLRATFEAALAPDVPLYNEYHALIVEHGKNICRVRPRCEVCCLKVQCPSASGAA
jgi:endonuclease-3 related protein